jgi:RNA polymerase sigma-70 factor (ECF subfamily)
MKQTETTFTSLYRRYANDVYRFAYWLCGDADEAKDIASETFVRVWTADVEPNRGSIKAFLLTIARNLYLHERRKSKKRAVMPEQVVDQTLQPDQLAEAVSDLQRTMSLLQTLPEIDRAVLLMRAEAGLSYEEIADATGLTLASVKVKIYRARKTLQAKF